jgi:hypothetical protein
MSDVERYADELVRVSKCAKEFVDSVRCACGGSFQWGIEQIAASYKSMFDRFCPYEVGDRVQLTKSPPSALEEGSGWYPSRHFLIAGSAGEVRNRGYSDNQFIFDVVFDNESWIGDKGVVHLMELDHKHTYRISEKCLRLEEGQ